MSTVVCITGMHRSGTSLTASWLKHCGLELGHGGLYGPTRSNPEGHFEDIEIVNLHSHFLQKAFPDSKGWIVFRRLPAQMDDEFRERAQKIVSERDSRYPVWGWKDPRTISFLSWWKQIIPEMKTIILHRSWQDTVQSLMRRSRRKESATYSIHYIQGLRMWEHFAISALRYQDQNNESTLLVSVQDLLRDDRRFINDVNNLFRIQLPFHPLRDVYKRDYLQESKPNWLVPIFSGILGLSRLEKQLMSHSWSHSG